VNRTTSLSLRALIIGDEGKDTEQIVAALRGHWPELEIKRVNTAPALKEALNTGTFDCILCDMDIPTLSARKALDIISQVETPIPFLILSGVTQIEGTLDLLKNGADDFIRKSYLSRLVPAIEKAMRKAEIRQTAVISEKRLNKSAEDYRNLYESSDIALWSEDVSAVFANLKHLDFDNSQALREYLGSDNKQTALELTRLVKVRHVNAACLDLFEAANEQSFLSNISQSFGPGALDVFIDELCAFWDKQTMFRAEANFKTLGGQDFKALISLPIPTDEAGLRNIPVSIIDVTKVRRMESLLRDAEKRSHAWLEHSPVCTKILDLDFNLQYMSSAGVQGLHIDDITAYYGKPYPFDFFPRQYRSQMIESFNQAVKTGEAVTQEGLATSLNGQEQWYRSTIVPVADANDELEYLMVVSEDITEKRQLIKELEQHRSQLEKRVNERTRQLNNARKRAESQQALLSQAARIAHMGYSHWDQVKHEYISVSEGYAQILGYTSAEYLERFSTLEQDMQTVHPDDRARVAAYNDLVEDRVTSIEYRALHRDGHVILREGVRPGHPGRRWQYIGVHDHSAGYF